MSSSPSLCKEVKFCWKQEHFFYLVYICSDHVLRALCEQTLDHRHGDVAQTLHRDRLSLECACSGRRRRVINF